MHFCYIDESGTPDIPGNTSHYILAGLSIPISHWKACESEIQLLKSKYALQDAEIHTGWLLWPYLEQSKIIDFEKLSHPKRVYEVNKYRNGELLRLQTKGPGPKKTYHKTKKNYKATEDYIHLTFAERKQFMLEIAKLIGSWGFARLFAECIDKLHFNPAATHRTIDEQAFEQIVSRFEHFLKISSKVSKSPLYGLLIHDNNDTVKKKHTNLMKGFHASGTFWTSITNIIETPMFVDSQLTSMIQIADVCSYAIRRYLEKGEDWLFDEIFKRADKKNGKVVGVRHFSQTSCSCKICLAHK